MNTSHFKRFESKSGIENQNIAPRKHDGQLNVTVRRYNFLNNPKQPWLWCSPDRIFANTMKQNFHPQRTISLFNFSMWYQLFFTNLVDQMPKLKKAQLLLLTSTQRGFTCIKFTIETLVQCMKYLQS